MSMVLLVFVLSLLSTLSGCSRGYHRARVDREANGIIHSKSNISDWNLKDYSISPDHRSRYYDPFNPDCEPMPQDDPASHELMHCVNGEINGLTCGINGYTEWTENPYWAQYLVFDENGELLLDRKTAVELALIHSPDYQKRLEAVYLSAMNLSFSRFDFDVHYSSRPSLDYTADGKDRGGNSTLGLALPFEAEKKAASGAQFLIGLANTMTWQFAGQDSSNINTIFNFSVVQPLLRNAGRDIVLEELTTQERLFLGDIRELARYRQDFYIQTVHSGGGGSGYLGLLSQKVRIQNQRQNNIQLEDNLERMTQMFNAGRAKAYDVETTRRSFLSSQLELIRQIGNYENQVENYLTSMIGFPPNIKVKVEDPLLEQFELMAPSLTRLQGEAGALQGILRNETQPIPDDVLEQIAELEEKTLREIKLVYRDLERLEKNKGERIEGLRVLAERPEIRNGEVSPVICDVEAFLERIEIRKAELPEQEKQLGEVMFLMRLFQKYDREELTRRIELEDFDQETLETINRLEMYDLVPVFREEVGNIRNRYSQARFKKGDDTQIYNLQDEQKKLKTDLQKIQLAVESYGKSPEAAAELERMRKNTLEALAENERKLEMIEETIQAEIQALIRKWVERGGSAAAGGRKVPGPGTIIERPKQPVQPLENGIENENENIPDGIRLSRLPELEFDDDSGFVELPPEDGLAGERNEITRVSYQFETGGSELDFAPDFEIQKFDDPEIQDPELEFVPTVEPEPAGQGLPRPGLADARDDSVLDVIVDPYRNWMNKIVQRLYNELLVLTIVQSRMRLDTITLNPIDISSEEAFDLAKEHRLDLMNERSNLVDRWRKIEYAANQLKGFMNIRFNGEIGTTHDNPVRFSASNSRASVGIEWDTPLNRKSEEIGYRRAQIEYQQARRDFYQYLDSIQISLRNSLRNVKNDQLNFEIQRASIFVSIIKLDLAQIDLSKPAGMGGAGENIARNLVESLSELLSAQNSFLDVWVTYQARRVNLEYEMGTFELDENGMWIDHGPLSGKRSGIEKTAVEDEEQYEETFIDPEVESEEKFETEIERDPELP